MPSIMPVFCYDEKILHFFPSFSRRMPTETPLLRNDTHRKIVHVDMDAFYASVEQRDRPELRGRPIAVGHADGRGVVATASYEARQFGVRSAMPSSRAKQLCPELIFVESRMSHYKAVSAEIHEIFRRYTEVIEPISIDEAFLDVTENKAGLALGVEVAKAIKMAIRTELHLVASAGVSYNKFLAKVASDWRKPDGLCTIHPDRALSFIDRLPVEAFWGVGPATAKRLHELGLDSAAKIRALSLNELIDHFGEMGGILYQFSRGIDNRPVRPERIRKSVGCEETFGEDIRHRALLEDALRRLAEELEGRLARSSFRGSTLTLKIRHYDFTTRTRSVSVGTAITDRREILRLADELLDSAELPERGVRLLGLTVSTPVDERQPLLFDLALMPAG